LIELKEITPDKAFHLIDKEIATIEEEINNGYKIEDDQDAYLQDLLGITSKEIKNAINVLTDKEQKYYRDLSDIAEIERASDELYKHSRKIREQMELRLYYNERNSYYVKRLRELYKEKKLKKKFPKFDLEKYLKILQNPFLEIKNFSGKIVNYDPFVVNKFMIAINQMLFDEMDLYIINNGPEGSGKSCHSSQIILWFYTTLKEVGLIDYAYDITKMFFSDILSMLQEQNEQKNNDFFRIMNLDEGNDLNKQNYASPDAMDFRYSMRTTRRNLRVVIINIQQIGELDNAISLSRANFIFDCQLDSNRKTGTLNKGTVDMYILPRGQTIYSPFWRKNFTRNDVKNAFAKKLEKKKDYYISLPNEFMIHRFKFHEAWGFDKGKYDEYIKNEIRKHSYAKGFKTSELIGYIIDSKLPKLKDWGTWNLKDPAEKAMYDNLGKWLRKIKKYFELYPEKRTRYQTSYNRRKNE